MPTSVTDIGASVAPQTSGKGQNIDTMSGLDFLKLLVSELSHQDPFEPMNNKEILEQLSAIRSLESNMTLAENIKGLLGHQELSSAAVLIGRWVAGVDTEGQIVEGRVERVVLDPAGVRLQIGDREMALDAVMQIGEADEAAAPAAPNGPVAQPVLPTGDIDGDGAVGALDRQELNRVMNGLAAAYPPGRYDLTGDGRLNAQDKMAMNLILGTLAP
jgi:flagellar basal-body rod modification protein FlgD